MAVNNPQAFMSTRRIPSEPCPLPSFSSDEESFVILGHSLSQDVEIPQSEELLEPDGASVIEEAKQLINIELQAMEQLSLRREEKSCATDSVWGSRGPVQEEDASPKTPAKSLEQSSITLPEMPRVERDFDSTNNMISIANFSTDLAPEELQTQISNMIEENIHLKDVLNQNNMSMKSQIERIVAWQEDVQKVHEAHKQKLMDAKDFIERLKKENINLNLEVENMREIISAKEKENSAMKVALQDRERKCNEKLAQTTDDNMKAFELDMANKKVKELESALKNLNSENAKLIAENTKLTAENKKLVAENKGLIADNSNLQEDVKQNENCKRQLEDLAVARKQIDELKTALATVQSLAAEKENSLISTVHELQAKLPQAEELVNARQQLASIQMNLTQTEYSRTAAYAQIASKNEQLNQLTREVLDLRTKIDELNSQNQKLMSEAACQDDIFAIRTQLEIFKTDFEAERSAKEVIKGEKEQLVEDLQNLQRRNQQLQEEIELVRDNRDYVVYPTNSRERTTRNSPSAPAGNDSPPPRRYACPLCSSQFRSVRLLEDHVDTCIDIPS